MAQSIGQKDFVIILRIFQILLSLNLRFGKKWQKKKKMLKRLQDEGIKRPSSYKGKFVNYRKKICDFKQ